MYDDYLRNKLFLTYEFSMLDLAVLFVSYQVRNFNHQQRFIGINIGARNSSSYHSKIIFKF